MIANLNAGQRRTVRRYVKAEHRERATSDVLLKSASELHDRLDAKAQSLAKQIETETDVDKKRELEDAYLLTVRQRARCQRASGIVRAIRN